MPQIPRPQIAIYRPPGRPGVDQTLVEATANRLLEQGERPTVARVRREIGGSPNTIGPMLDTWWRRLGERVRSKAPSALDRLPGRLGLIAEAFFQEALEQARGRAQTELTRDREVVEGVRQDTEVRAHLLSQREKEFEQLIRRDDERIKTLEADLRRHILYERKLLAAQAELERRMQSLLVKLDRLKRAKAQRSARASKTPTKPGKRSSAKKKPVQRAMASRAPKRGARR